MRASKILASLLTISLASVYSGCGGNEVVPDAAVVVPVDMAMLDLTTYPACQGPYPTGAAFNTSPGDVTPRSLAADFTLPTLAGDWTFSQNWTGCDSYIFMYFNASNPGSTDLWGSSVDDLIAASPRNVHYFFLSDSLTDSTVMSQLMMVKANVDSAISALSTDDQTYWNARFHYVTKGIPTLGNWITKFVSQLSTSSAAAMQYPPPAFAIDRFQQIRLAGYLAPVTGAAASPQEMDYLANEVRYYNFEWSRQQALDAETQPTIVHVLSGQNMNDTVNVTFPDAATMASFDTMELDLTMMCKDHLETNCAAWDYIQYLTLCDLPPAVGDGGGIPDGGAPSCNTSIGRFITTYHREGRWVVDVSPLLALLQSGGTRTMQYSSQYLNGLDIRLSNSGKGGHPASVTPLWAGEWGFDPTYNANFMPVTAMIPADASRVQLFAFISGHGFGDKANCAEFCDHQHHFTVNGTEYLQDFPNAGSSDGCSQEVDTGTVPNQYGTWPIGRGGWCPGREVVTLVADVTANVTPGQMATVTYRGTYMDKDYVSMPGAGGGFGALIRMESFLVYWKK